MTNAEALAVLHRIQATLLGVDQRLNLLNLKEPNMALDPTISAVITQLDTATNNIASRIQKLIDQATQAGSVSAAEVVSALQPEVDRLTALGQDPTNPVPAQ